LDKRSLLLISRDSERRVFVPRVQRSVTDRRIEQNLLSTQTFNFIFVSKNPALIMTEHLLILLQTKTEPG